MDDCHLHFPVRSSVFIPSYLYLTVISLAALRRNFAFIALLLFLTITFALLGAAEFSGKTTIAHAGGATGVITALIGKITPILLLYSLAHKTSSLLLCTQRASDPRGELRHVAIGCYRQTH